MSDLDNWNPMEEDFKSSDLNSYDTGPGARLPKDFPANIKKKRNPLKLHVRNIPEKLNEDSFRNLFSVYGNVVDAFICFSGDHRWGGIIYDNPNSAQEALSQLHDHPVFKFKISIFNEKEKTTSDEKRRPKEQQQYQSMNKAEFETSYNNFMTYQESQFINERNSFYRPFPLFNTRSSVGDSVNPQVNSSCRSSITKMPPQIPSGFKFIPTCVNCEQKTLETCTMCKESFCSKKCMVLGFQHHTQQCIAIAPHSTDFNTNKPLSNGKSSTPVPTAGAVPLSTPQKDMSRLDHSFNPNAGMNQFMVDAIDYRQHHQTVNQQNLANSSRPSISNSYDNDDLTNQISNHKENSVYVKNYHSASDTDNREDVIDSGGKFYKNRPTKTRDSFAQLTGKENKTPRTKNDDEFSGRKNENSGGRNEAFGNVGKDRNEVPKSENRTFNEMSRGDNRNRNDDTRHENRNRNESSRNENISERCGRNGGDSREQQQQPFRVSDDNVMVNTIQKRLDDVHIDYDSSSKFCEKKKCVDRSSKRSVVRGRSTLDDAANKDDVTDCSSSEEQNMSKQLSHDSKGEPDYVTNRRTYAEGDRLEVRLNEVTADFSQFSSVRIVEEESLLPKLMVDMMRETSLPPVDVKQMTKCLVCYDGKRVRGMIVSENPLKVKFIDTGFSPQECDRKSIRGMPEKYASIRPFAYKVKLLNGHEVNLEKFKEERKIFDIIIRKKLKEFIWEAEIVASEFNERLEEARQQRASRNSRESIEAAGSGETQLRNGGKIDAAPKLVENFALTPGTPVNVFVTFIEEDKKTFFVTRYDDIKKVMTVITDSVCPKLEDIEKYTLCLAPLHNIWYRARIEETDPVKVCFIDFGNTAVVGVDELKKLPEKLSNVDPLAIKVKLAEGVTTDYKIEESGFHRLKPVEKNFKKKLWTVVSDECLDVSVLEILSKEQYHVIQTGDCAVVEEINQLPKNPLKSEPKIGGIYLIEYEHYWWRAQLIKESPPTVKYIDYGNEEEISYDRLYELPPEWQQKHPLAFKITVVPEPAQTLKQWTVIRIKSIGNNQWKIVL